MYKNKRVGNKIITTYLGPANKSSYDKKTSRNLLSIIFGILAVLLLFFLFNGSFFTARVGLELDTSYKEGEILSGNLKFNLKEGELIPKEAKVRVSFGNESKEIALSEFVSMEGVIGEFFAEGVEISGNGEGYGITGKREIYPEVEFELRVFSGVIETPTETPAETPSASPSETATPETTEMPVETPAEESVPEQGNSESAGEETENSGAESSEEVIGESAITGSAVSESEIIISGKVKKGEVFSENLNEGENAELVSGSVKVNGNVIDDGEVKLNIKEGKAEVTTEYAIEEEGFGEEYLGKKELKLDISLDKFEINVTESGKLIVELVYNENVIVSAEEEINVLGKEKENENEEKEEKEEEEIIELNETVVEENVTIVNETIVNESLVRVVGNVSVNISTIQFGARLGEPVKWKKKIELNGSANIVVEIPASAENVSIIKISKSEEEMAEESKENEEGVLNDSIISEEVVVENATVIVNETINNENVGVVVNESIIIEEEVEEVKVDIHGNVIHGSVSAEIELSKEPKIVSWFKKLFRITGNVVQNESVSENVRVIAVEINSSEKGVEIVYETPAPYSIEEGISNGKRVKIVGPDDVHYENILSFTELNESLNIVEASRVKIYWRENNSFVTPSAIDDLDGDGIYDYVEWVTPHLSNQTFDIILITKAEHLDSNRAFIEDVYDAVKERDGNWTLIPAGDYVRVVFERNLTFDRDITIYARSNYSGSVEVYEKDGIDVIADFGKIFEDKEYKVYLNNLVGGQDVFDLLVKGGSVEFDWVVDPSQDITTCQDLNSANTIYNLTADVSATETCFTVSADNITLQGNANGWTRKITYNTDGYGGTGIDINANNFTLRNISVTPGMGAGGGSMYSLDIAANLTVTAYSVNLTGFADTTVDSIVYFSGVNSSIALYDSFIGSTGGFSYEDYELSLSSGSNSTLINVTLLNSVFQFSGNGYFNKGWYLDAYANYTNGTAASNVNISALNNNNALQFSVLTGSNGRIGQQTLIEYRKNATTTTYYSNYTFNASSPVGPEILSQSWNMTANRDLQFSFKPDSTYPTVTINYPPNNTQITNNNSVLLNWTIQDNANNSEIFVWASNDSTNLYDYLVYHRQGMANGTWTYNLSSPLTNPRTDGLILLTHLDNSTVDDSLSDVITDSGGRTGSPNYKTGKFAESLNITSGNYGYFNHSSELVTNNESFAVSVWFNMIAAGTLNGCGTGCNAHYPIVTKGAGEAETAWQDVFFSVGVNASNSVVGAYESVAASSYGFTTGSTQTISLNQWYHVVYMKNATGGSIWINGVLSGTNLTTRSPSSRSVQRIGIGVGYLTTNATTTGNFIGLIDEIAIFNRSLSPTEITNLYNLSLGKYYWRVNATDGTNMNSSGIYEFNTSVVVEADTTAPSISFVAPTSANGISTTSTSIEINASITETSLGEVKFNWNGTNYTIYDDNLMLMFNFENLSALGENDTFVRDLSKYGNNGTVNGGISWSSSVGKYGGAFNFIKANNYIAAGGAGLPSQPSLYSLEAWVYFNNFADGFGMIWSRNSDSGNTIIMLLGVRNSSGRLDISHNNNLVNSGYSVSSGIWNHFITRYNGTTASLFVNGVEKWSSVTGALSSSTSCAVLLGIDSDSGCAGSFGSDDINGSIDNFMFYNRSLSDSEIMQHYFMNLYKYNNSGYALYVNQSKNSTTGLGIGNYTYFASAKDSTGNENLTETRSINIDTTIPVITINSPANNSNVTTPYALLNWTIQDDSNSDEVWVYVSNSTYDVYSRAVYHKKGEANGTYSYNLTSLPLRSDTANLVLLLRFDNNSAYGENTTLAYDYSDGGKNATCSNCPRFNFDGKLAGKMEFDGVNDLFQIADDAAGGKLDGLRQFTIMGWVNVTGDGATASSGNGGCTSHYPVISKGYGIAESPSADLSFFVGINSTSNTMCFDIEDTTSTNNIVHSATTFDDNELHHFAAVRDGSSSLIYVDGVLEGNNTWSGTPTLNNTHDVGIGRSCNGATCTAGAFNGTLDDIAIINRSLSGSEIAEHYNLSLGMKYWRVNASDSAGNMNSSGVYQFNMTSAPINVAPSNPVVNINSTLATNKTAQDLNCYANVIDPDGGRLNVTVDWFNGTIRHLRLDYNNSYTNNSLFIAVLDDANTTKGHNWSCGMRLYDGADYSSWVNSTSLRILNTAPNVSLTSPAHGNITTNRTPTFAWGGSDDDSDSLQYELNLTCYYGGGGTCTVGNRYVQRATIGSSTSYSITPYLEYLIDNNYYYNWTIRAWDGEEYGVWFAVKRNISVQSDISISLPSSSVAFGNMNNSQSKNTSGDSPYPLELRNDGNALLNISVNFTSLFSSAASPTSNYQFMVRNRSAMCFITSGTQTSWANAPTTTSLIINQLNFTSGYQTGCNNASIDLLITVPAEEPPGDKNSIVTFISSLGEPGFGAD